MIPGEKITLRALEKEDLENCCKWINDPEIIKGLGVVFPMSRYEEEKWYENYMKDERNKIFAIDADKKHIGNIGLHNIDWISKKAMLGIMIGKKDYLNKGYGTDAVKTILKFTFGNLNLNKIYLTVLEYNKRAIRCYEKCGFKKEGVMKEDVFRDGRYYNTLFMSILRSEFNAV